MSEHLPKIISDQLAISTSEARRLITTGIVKRDGEPVTDLDVEADGATLTVGKRRSVVLPNSPLKPLADHEAAMTRKGFAHIAETGEWPWWEPVRASEESRE